MLTMTNAPTTFMNLMNNIFKDYLEKYVLVFLDDILIYSQDREDHEKYLRLTLEILRKNKLFGKLFKCEFLTSQVQYLGHVISINRLTVDLKKIELIMNWTTPKNVVKMYKFIGLDGYYHKLIKDFSKVAYTITHL